MKGNNILDADIISGFPYAEPNCRGCGRPLLVTNAWMADGCPCGSALGVNSMNETRWRLLMQSHSKLHHQMECYQRSAATAPNYIADREQMPTTIWLACGRKIEVEYGEVKSEIEGGRAYLEITNEMHPSFEGKQ